MIDTTRQSGITDEMLQDLEEKPKVSVLPIFFVFPPSCPGLGRLSLPSGGLFPCPLPLPLLARSSLPFPFGFLVGFSSFGFFFYARTSLTFIQTKLFIDELLIAVKGGLANLRKVEAPPPKPVVEDPTVCGFFNLEILNSRRAAIEGLHDKEDSDDWSDDEWSD
jgi:hypothetical protein